MNRNHVFFEYIYFCLYIFHIVSNVSCREFEIKFENCNLQFAISEMAPTKKCHFKKVSFWYVVEKFLITIQHDLDHARLILSWSLYMKKKPMDEYEEVNIWLYENSRLFKCSRVRL